MKWINGLTWEEKVRRKKNWHRWFAWFPVIVEITSDHRKVKIWWDYVERKGTFYVTMYGDSYWTWEYREINKGK